MSTTTIMLSYFLYIYYKLNVVCIRVFHKTEFGTIKDTKYRAG